jgi:hypothetical protein
MNTKTLFIVAGLGLAYYFFLARKSKEDNTEKTSTEISPDGKDTEGLAISTTMPTQNSKTHENESKQLTLEEELKVIAPNMIPTLRRKADIALKTKSKSIAKKVLQEHKRFLNFKNQSARR